jgi:ornithine cyclodeaminase/alanine dehydrogenase-like protein (mu-crystallin family)
MVLFIHNDVVERVLSMTDCIQVQESAFKALEAGGAVHRPRIDMYAPTKRADGYYRWGTMEGWYDGVFAIRMKSDVITWPQTGNGAWTEEKYCLQPGTFCGIIMLFSSKNGEPLAMINDGVLQHMRVGGAAGIGAKHLARANAESVGMLGSGGMARTFLEAFCAVRPIKHCKVFSPTKKNREDFASEMKEKLGIEITPVDSAREAVLGADILSTATDSMTPTFEAGWLEPGMHIAMLGPCEISPQVEARCHVKIRQGIGGLKMPVTDRIRMEVGMSPIAWIAGTPEEMHRLPRRTPGSGFGGEYPDFCDLLYGRTKGRTSDEQITFYHNMGNQGLQFAAVGGLVLQKVCELGLGRSLPTSWFVQDIRD